MAGGKLSPRQKMINMMYLVLIALLALNVSKEILKAFHLMELSFDQSAQNIESKNVAIMNAFDNSMKDKPDFTRPWKQKADKVRQISKGLIDYINDVEKNIVGAEGRKPLEEGQAKGTKTELMMPDNMEAHANYFVIQGKGKPLQDKINKTREEMLAVLDDPEVKKVEKFKTLKSDLDKATSLRADDPKEKTEGGHTTWVSMYLEHSPLAGVTALLAKTKADCKNLEADILKALSEQIDATQTRVDKFAVFVNAPSSYVMAGSQYTADIVLAAYNSQDVPKITVNGAPITVENGIGKYTAGASGNGEHDLKAEIVVQTPTGPQTFNSVAKWTSFSGTAAISADKMNVLYVGLDNPITVSAPGVAPGNLIVSMSGSGSLSGSGGKYIAKVTATGNRLATVNVSAKMPDGKVANMGKMEYRVRTIPSPEPKWGTLSSGAQSKQTLMAMPRVEAALDNFVFEGVKWTVTSYTILASTRNGTKTAKVNGNSTAGARALIEQTKAGDLVGISEIKATGPGGVTKQLPAIIFTIK